MAVNELFKRSELCAIFKVHPETIRRWERDGKIARCNTSGRPRYSIEEVERLSNKKPKQDETSKQNIPE